MAVGRDLKGAKNNVVAVIGDGAMTAGQAYEAMNNAGYLDSDMIVILNDNKMSISKNVGEIANYLTRLRTDPKYFHAKAQMETALESARRWQEGA